MDLELKSIKSRAQTEKNDMKKKIQKEVRQRGENRGGPRQKKLKTEEDGFFKMPRSNSVQKGYNCHKSEETFTIGCNQTDQMTIKNYDEIFSVSKKDYAGDEDFGLIWDNQDWDIMVANVNSQANLDYMYGLNNNSTPLETNEFDHLWLNEEGDDLISDFNGTFKAGDQLMKRECPFEFEN